MTWNREQRPPSDVCPQRFCAFWVPPGGKADMSGREYDSLQDAMAVRDDWVEFPEGGCGCAFGACIRDGATHSGRDWYEPDEPTLESEGLPWFYFVSAAEKLAPEFRARFAAESRALWGDAHESDG